MASSNMRKLVIGCGAAVIAVAVVFWALSLLAAGAWHRELAPENRGASASSSGAPMGPTTGTSTDVDPATNANSPAPADHVTGIPIGFEATDAIRLTYTHEGEASTTFECEDTQLIAQVVDALRSIELGDTTTLAASDAGERLDFLLADGTRRSFYFEAGAYADGDASRVMTKGGDALSRALRTVCESGAVAEMAARDGR